ncbi:MAG TPA: acylphosphatase [Alphaproteobacteria bacterium]|nr:acylphosphatase [Alphaproteobacteria bacterium]
MATTQIPEPPPPELPPGIPKIAMRILVFGFVQGVSYRRWLQGEALSRGVNGWTRNRSDGTVEGLLHGDPRQVEDLIRACRHGPLMARVDRVQAEPAEYDGLIEDFRIEATIEA